MVGADPEEKGPGVELRSKTGGIGSIGVGGNPGLDGVLEGGGAFRRLCLARAMSSWVDTGAMMV